MILILRLLFVPFYSLFSRLWQGEGAMLALTAALLWRFGADQSAFLLKILTAFFSLPFMYALNDIHDAPLDIKDPGRINNWNQTLAAHRKIAFVVHGFETLVLAAACLCFTPVNFLHFSITLLLSSVYTLWAKPRPIFDVLTVSLWGSAFVVTFCGFIPVGLAACAGLMIAMNHAFQMARDRIIDRKNGVMTSAVKSELLNKWIFYAAATLVVVCFAVVAKFIAAAFAAFCIASALWLGFSRTSWLFSKGLQALAWISALYL